jgi:Tfp pilus assembly protein FimT
MNQHAFAEAPVLAALVAAFSALVIAVFQFFTQRRQSTSIEELKAKLSQQGAMQAKYLETYLNLLNGGHQLQAQAYTSLLQGVQLLRDKIRNFLQQPDSYHIDVICEEISEQAEAILTTYSANQLQFGETGRQLGHSVKNLADKAANEFKQLRRSRLDKSEYVAQLSNIKEIGEVLSELQTRLRKEANAAYETFAHLLEAHNGNTH